MPDPSAAPERPTAVATARMVGIVAVVGVVLLGLAGGVVVAPDLLQIGEGQDFQSTEPTTSGSPGAGAGDAGGGSGDGTGSGDDPEHVRPFTLTIDDVVECGRTCRDVTASVTNNGGNPRTDVTVETEIRTGEDVVWEGRRPIGTLVSDETATHTERVELGLVDAARIEANDGVVTVVTTVTWDGGSATYRDRMQVA